MPLIVAIEPDRNQASQLTAIVRGRLRAELVLADSAELALAALGDRVPDLILTTPLLSTKDEAALADRLRELDSAASHVQTLTIPVFDTPAPRANSARTVLFGLLSERSSSPATPEGCDPAVFAEQCAEYLERARHDRQHELRPDLDIAESPAVALPMEPAPSAEPVAPPMVAAAVESEIYDDVVYDDDVADFIAPMAEPIAAPIDEVVAAAPTAFEPPAAPEPPPAIEQIAPVVPIAPAAAPAPVAPMTAQPAAPTANEEVEVDLTAMLDEAVVRQLTAAIESVSREPIRPARSSSPRVAAWTPSTLGSPASWAGMDRLSADIGLSTTAKSTGAVPSRKFPERKPIQDEWGFFDPEQCGFATLLAKLDEITRRVPDSGADR